MKQRLIDANKLMADAEFKGQYDLVSARDIVNQPTVEAIPIDWIKDYMLRLPDGSEAYECILVMLEEWERDFGIKEDSDELLEKLSDILSVFPKLQGLIMDVLEEKKND